MDESDTTRTVWIVFNCRNATGNTVFHTTEVDDAVTALMTTAAMA
jgi:hypothetical protein